MIAFDPLQALRVLNEHGVRFVIIGGLATGLRGAAYTTFDLDICYRRDPANNQALAIALRELGATLRGAPAGLPFQLDARTIALGDSFTFDTTAGALDCLGTPAGTQGYDDLMRNASEMDINGVPAFVASIDDLLRMKRTAARVKDRAAIDLLEALKAEQNRKS
jgi:hypothetical protein